MPSSQPDYSVPALDKALDILEYLAAEAGGRSQTEIADAVGRSVSQVFRVLTTLERRGYLYRDRTTGLYGISMALFDLAHRQPPLRGLIGLALGPMRELAEEVSQSCNLGILDGDAVRIIAQAESPANFGYTVRVGALFPLDTAAGAVLSGADTSGADTSGAVTRPDPEQAAITDVVVPIRDAAGATIAALTVPYVGTSYSAHPLDAVLVAAKATGSEISARLAGRHARTDDLAPLDRRLDA
jgi:DNA-binding IclR family transcriptional regulator